MGVGRGKGAEAVLQVGEVSQRQVGDEKNFVRLL